MSLRAALTAAAVSVIPLQLPPLPPLPCLPGLPCPPVPIPPVPPLPPAQQDQPPALSPLAVARKNERITISWNASDDRALAAFRLYRDGWLLGQRGPQVRQVSLKLLCKRHSYRVEAIDSSLQRTSRSVSVLRRCTDNP